MNTPMYIKLTNLLTKVYNNSVYNTVSFVDYTTNIVGGGDINNLSNSLTYFHCLLSSFYFLNKLKRNHEKLIC